MSAHLSAGFQPFRSLKTTPTCVQVSKSEQNLSAMFDNSIEEDGMSMLDMDHGINLDNATMADSIIGGLWPGDDPSPEPPPPARSPAIGSD